MPPKRSKSRTAKMLAQCRQLPGELRSVCQIAARSRYDRHYHPENPTRRRHILVDAAMAATLVIVLVFALYVTIFYRRAAVHQQIELSIVSSQPAVASGDAMFADITVQNNSKQSLRDVYVTIPPSSGFVLSHSRPAIGSQQRIQLGTIQAEQSSTIEIEGYAVGGVGTSARISAVVHYRTNGFESLQEKLVSETIYISGSQFALTARFPESIAANKPFDFEITFDNQSQVTNFPNVAIVPTFPPNWETLSSQPSNDPATDSWAIDSVGSLQSGKITGQARLNSRTATMAEIKIQLFASPDGRPLLQDEVTLSIPVFYPRVTVDATLLPPRVSLGGTIEAIVDVFNGESFTLSGSVLRFAINESLMDVSAYASGTYENGVLTIPVSSMFSEAERQVVVEFPLRDTINASQVFGNDEVLFDLRGELVYTNDRGETVVVPISSEQAQINSDLSLHANARYYTADGEAIGTGPLPPSVGETTTYWVFISVENQLHPVRDAVVTARVPKGVIWEGRASVGAGDPLGYDESTGLISWNVGSLPDYKTNYGTSRFGAAFQLSLTPDSSQTGKMVTLLEDIRVVGIDRVTGSRLQAVFEDVTTQLKFDANAKDDGRVSM